jgi:mycothiol synthase
MSKELNGKLTIRAYGGEQDIPAIVALFNAAAEVDGPEFGRTEDEIRRIMAEPGVMPEENAFLFEVDGELVGYGRTQLETGHEESVFFMRGGMVHPGWRRRGIGTRVIKRLEQRIQERLGEAPTEKVYIATGTNLKFKDRQALFAKMGYRVARYYFDMERPLWENGSPLALPEPAYPPGIVVRTMVERADLRAVWQTTDDAFGDHWGHTETTLEQWQHWTSSPNHRPDLWLVAWDEEKDEVAGVCLNGVDPDHNERVGRQEGWVYVLAVRRPYRKQGLGRALLLAGLHALQKEGMAYAMLGVDTENLTGALRLYEGVGFYDVKKYAGYRKLIRA